MAERTMSIFEKMSKITTELTAVAKNLEVGYGQSKYKAVGEADVLHAVKPLEAKYGVYSYPMTREIVESDVLESIDSRGNTKRSLYLRLKTTYRFVNLDDPSDSVLMETYSDGVDPQDKAPGKAMTYGDKYALLKAYKIITGEDPDQYASEPLQGKGSVNIPRPDYNGDPQLYHQDSAEEAQAAQKAAEVAKQPIGETRAKSLTAELIKNGADPIKVCELYKVPSIRDLTEAQQLNIIKNMAKVVEKCPYQKEA